MLDIDTAIKHCFEAAEQKERDSAELIDILDEQDVTACKECAADHRQLAEWLTELKEAKALLKEAVNSLYYNYHYASKAEIRLCYCDKCLNSADCSKDIDKCKFVWWKRDELLKLFKED